MRMVEFEVVLVAHLAVIVPVRDFEQPIFVGIIPNSVRRFVDVSRAARSCPNKETSQPENRGELFLRLIRLWLHPLCLRQCDTQTFPSGHWRPGQRCPSSSSSSSSSSSIRPSFPPTLVFIAKLPTAPSFLRLVVCPSP
ncbi:hypothetical protein SprV_0200842500 [Sparganum proliferum]